jgi:hypothetical protein
MVEDFNNSVEEIMGEVMQKFIESDLEFMEKLRRMASVVVFATINRFTVKVVEKNILHVRYIHNNKTAIEREDNLKRVEIYFNSTVVNGNVSYLISDKEHESVIELKF